MKKAKIMLTAITVLAVAGGALAFKAKSTYTGTVYTGTGGVCTQPVSPYTTTNQGVQINVSTTSLTKDCPLGFTTTAL